MQLLMELADMRYNLSAVPDSFFGWERAADGVVILDASADNFVMTREGLVPIDLQMSVFSREELQEAGFIKEWFR